MQQRYRDIFMRWISCSCAHVDCESKSVRASLGQHRWHLLLVLIALFLLAGCSVPWSSVPALTPTPTVQYAGGEPVLPRLQKLYHDAPALLPGNLTVAQQSWPLAGHDPANTFAAASVALKGVTRWFFQTPGPALTAPVVAGGLTLFNGGDGVLYAVNSQTGALQWRVPVGDTLVAGTPAVADSIVYVAAQGHGLMAINLRNGAILWKVDTQLPVRAAPVVVGSLLLVLAGANDLFCLNRQTGAEYWDFKSEDVFANFWPSQGQPAVTTADGGLVFVALGASTEFNALKATTGRKAWEYTVDSRMVGAPVYDAQLGLVFVATWLGHIYALNAATGLLKWRFDLPDAGALDYGFASGPALANGTLYIGDYQGQIFAINALTGKPRWSMNTGGSTLATPAVRLEGNTAADIYVANQDGNLEALSAATGQPEWHIYLGELRSAPVLSNGMLFVSSGGDHGLFALG
jgi:eukaryotic-like serine/threonine-protein kinase